MPNLVIDFNFIFNVFEILLLVVFLNHYRRTIRHTSELIDLLNLLAERAADLEAAVREFDLENDE